MAYTHFRMIAYEIPTVTRIPNGNWESGWDAGQEPPDVARIPVPDTVSDDARIRLKRMANVVDLAEKRLKTLGVQNDTTLNIFIMPEFYFRPPNLGAKYAMNTYPDNVASQIFKALNGMFVHDDFKHWLFVCGTVLWNTLNDEFAKVVYFNTAVHVRGGSANRNSIGLVEKQEASWMDGVTQNRSPGLAPDVAPIFQDWSNRRLRVFQRDGLTFGLEICLDHADQPQYRTLRRVRNDWATKEGKTWPGVHIHLLSAGGMGINMRSVTTRDFGYLVRNDGLAGEPQLNYINSELKWVMDYFPDDQIGFAGLENVPATDAQPVPNTQGMLVPIPMGRNSFTQRYVIYPKMPLP